MPFFKSIIAGYFNLVKRSPFALLILWLIFCTILFCLPGSVTHSVSWLDKIYFDKWVHVGLFAISSFLWTTALWAKRKAFNLYNASVIFLSLSIYGASIELIQHFFIAHRSMDIYDLCADMVGILAGIYLYKKMKPL